MSQNPDTKPHTADDAPRQRRRLLPRPPSRKQRVKYAFETVLAFLFYGLFRIMPVAVASAAGGFIMSRIGPRMGASRTARRNLLRAFPEKTEAEREEIVRGMWDNLGRVVAEYPHLRGISSRIEIENKDVFDLMRPQGADGKTRPAIFFGGHLANWEVSGVFASRLGIKIHVVYRKPNNPGVERLLRYARGGHDVGHIAKGVQGAREMFNVLRKGEALGILMDQKLTEGIPVPFFGFPAMTATAIAQFAFKFNCPVIPAQVQRLPGARFRLRLHPPLGIPHTDDRDADTLAMLTDINQHLEQWIRERPAEWLWLHRRWPEQV